MLMTQMVKKLPEELLTLTKIMELVHLEDIPIDFSLAVHKLKAD